MTPEMTQTVLFFVGGLVGAALRAAMSTSQATFARSPSWIS